VAFRITRLYDVISAQPSADAGQIRRNKMNLPWSSATAVILRSIRSCLGTSFRVLHRLGIGAAILEQIFEDIGNRAPKAREKVKQTLPADFLEEIAASIMAVSMLARIRHADKGPTRSSLVSRRSRRFCSTSAASDRFRTSAPR
jgi:hypothetical protein